MTRIQGVTLDIGQRNGRRLLPLQLGCEASFSGVVDLSCAITPVITPVPTCSLSSSQINLSGGAQHGDRLGGNYRLQQCRNHVSLQFPSSSNAADMVAGAARFCVALGRQSQAISGSGANPGAGLGLVRRMRQLRLPLPRTIPRAHRPEPTAHPVTATSGSLSHTAWLSRSAFVRVGSRAF